jgi:hypothetical protein
MYQAMAWNLWVAPSKEGMKVPSIKIPTRSMRKELAAQTMSEHEESRYIRNSPIKAR